MALVGSSSLSEVNPKLKAEAEKYHKFFQQSSEGIIIGKIEEAHTSFGAAGHIHKKGPQPTQHTAFEIGSITKVFTAILLAESIREGRVQLEDSAAKYLPSEVLSPKSPLQTITLKQLATHTSGLPRLPANIFAEADPRNPYAHYSVEKLYSYLKALKSADLGPTDKQAYSNLGFGLLGHILARVWKMSYADLIETKILRPLGMNRTWVGEASKPRKLPQMAVGHHEGREAPTWDMASLEGAGAIVSTAHDLLIFARAHWDPDSPKGLAASLKRVQSAQMPNYGLGWVLRGDTLFHNGQTGGFRATLTITPKNKTASVRLINNDSASWKSSERGGFGALAGYWEGDLNVGPTVLPQVLYIREEGAASLYSLNQGGHSVEASFREIDEEGNVTLVFPRIEGHFSGQRDQEVITGIWTQNAPWPLTLTRTKQLPDALKVILEQRIEGTAESLVGYWSGLLGELFIYMKVTAIGSSFEAQLFSPDQLPYPMTIDTLSVRKNAVNFAVSSIQGTFKGEMKDKVLSGTWTQGGAQSTVELKWSATKPQHSGK